MNTFIKVALKRLINGSVRVIGKTPIGRYVYALIFNDAMSRTQVVAHGGMTMIVSIPTALNKYRADTFSTKEPETLEWIDSIPRDSLVWDIGANIGLYTCYAAKSRGCRVFAFEPSVFNLGLLARNIALNGIADRAVIVPLPLSDALAVSALNMTSTDLGGALSTFGQTYGHDGQALHPVFTFQTIGVSMVDAVELLRIPQPDYIKMDVDGIEHLILKGGMPVLRAAKGVLIEINDQFIAQARDASRYLEEAGFSLKEKRHADYFDSDSGPAKYTFNQIWTKEPNRQ